MQQPLQEFEKQAFEHAWNWFEYHATQRMTTIRFYLIIAGAIATGIGYLWSGHYYFFAMILSAFGVVASISFRRLDLRVSHLVKLGESALKHQQKKMATLLHQPSLEICEYADQMNVSNGWRRFVYPYSYSENISVLIGSSTLAFAAAYRMLDGQVCKGSDLHGGTKGKLWERCRSGYGVELGEASHFPM